MHGMRCAATSGFAGKRISNAIFYSMPWNPGERICIQAGKAGMQSKRAKQACKAKGAVDVSPLNGTFAIL